MLGGGRPEIGQARPLDIQSAPSGGAGMMLRASREAQPAPRRVRSGFVAELALEDKQLGTLLIGYDAQVCFGLPSFEAHQVREAGLLVERLVSDCRNRARLPGKLVGVDDDVAALPARELPQLDEQDAAGFRKRCMAKAFRIQEKRAGGPVPVLVGEHALEHQNLLSLGMIVRRKPRAWLVAHDRRNLAGLRRTHQMDSLAPDRPLGLGAHSIRVVSATARTERFPLTAATLIPAC